MENTSLVALSRQIALQREMSVVANNIANLNTTGYKTDASVFEEYLAPVARADNFIGSDGQLSFVQDRATRIDLSQGPFQQTGNPLDLAIDGDAFFVVRTAQGEERYTRNGALQINAAGELVTSQGAPVLGAGGPIVFQPGDRDISISNDGTISVREGPNAKSDSVRGQLRLASFAQPHLLEKDGASTFRAPAEARPQAPTESRVIQGSLEKSNVRGVIEMTRMIEISRTYQTVSALLERQSDLRRTAIEKLAETPA